MNFVVPKASESWSGLCRNMTEDPFVFFIAFYCLGEGRTDGQTGRICQNEEGITDIVCSFRVY